jgi:molybdate transport system regulatory protein
MNEIHLSIRVDCASGFGLGPGKIALLEAIRSTGSITSAAKSIGMSYRKAWLLVDEINHALRKPVVATKRGGSEGGGTSLTPLGEQIISLYNEIELHVGANVGAQCRAIGKLVRAVC